MTWVCCVLSKCPVLFFPFLPEYGSTGLMVILSKYDNAWTANEVPMTWQLLLRTTMKCWWSVHLIVIRHSHCEPFRSELTLHKFQTENYLYRKKDNIFFFLWGVIPYGWIYMRQFMNKYYKASKSKCVNSSYSTWKRTIYTFWYICIV